jgi:drug/metabolite transporter (DMT)-like permease
MSHRSAVLLLVLTAFLWSLGGVLIKSVDCPAMATAGVRSAIAAVILWAWLRRPQFTWSRAQIVAAIAYVGTVSLFVIANRLTTAANAIFLQYTAPIYVAIAGPFFLGERARTADWVCVAVALAGLALFFREQISPEATWGLAAGLASGLCFATMVIALRHQRDASPISSLLLGNIATALVGLPFLFGSAGKFPTAHEWQILVLLGVVQLGIPYVLYGLAIRRVTALEAILIPALEPVLNPTWVALKHHEIPGPWSLAGGALVLTAVLARGLVHRTPPVENSDGAGTAG